MECAVVCMPHWYTLRNRAGYLDSLLSLYLHSCGLLYRHRPHLPWAMGKNWRRSLCYNTPISPVQVYRTAVSYHRTARIQPRGTPARVVDVIQAQGLLPPPPRRGDRTRTDVVVGQSLHANLFLGLLTFELGGRIYRDLCRRCYPSSRQSQLLQRGALLLA